MYDKLFSCRDREQFPNQNKSEDIVAVNKSIDYFPYEWAPDQNAVATFIAIAFARMTGNKL